MFLLDGANADVTRVDCSGDSTLCTGTSVDIFAGSETAADLVVVVTADKAFGELNTDDGFSAAEVVVVMETAAVVVGY